MNKTITLCLLLSIGAQSIVLPAQYDEAPTLNQRRKWYQKPGFLIPAAITLIATSIIGTRIFFPSVVTQSSGYEVYLPSQSPESLTINTLPASENTIRPSGSSTTNLLREQEQRMEIEAECNRLKVELDAIKAERLDEQRAIRTQAEEAIATQFAQKEAEIRRHIEEHRSLSKDLDQARQHNEQLRQQATEHDRRMADEQRWQRDLFSDVTNCVRCYVDDPTEHPFPSPEDMKELYGSEIKPEHFALDAAGATGATGAAARPSGIPWIGHTPQSRYYAALALRHLFSQGYITWGQCQDLLENELWASTHNPQKFSHNDRSHIWEEKPSKRLP